MKSQLEKNAMKNYTELVFATNSGAVFTLTYSGSNDIDFIIENSDGIQWFDISAVSMLAQGLAEAKALLAEC